MQKPSTDCMLFSKQIAMEEGSGKARDKQSGRFWMGMKVTTSSSTSTDAVGLFESIL